MRCWRCPPPRGLEKVRSKAVQCLQCVVPARCCPIGKVSHAKRRKRRSAMPAASEARKAKFLNPFRPEPGVLFLGCPILGQASLLHHCPLHAMSLFTGGRGQTRLPGSSEPPCSKALFFSLAGSRQCKKQLYWVGREEAAGEERIKTTAA